MFLIEKSEGLSRQTYINAEKKLSNRILRASL